MASQTPTLDQLKDLTLSDNPYVYGWAAMTRMMMAGSSWSGHERNCCFMNLQDGTFADVSIVSGTDFLDDGRTVAEVDWDGDGDLDLWLRNRTGPQLRIMRNDQPVQSYIALELRGTRCNRDAVGARVVLHTADRQFTRTLTIGDGYLAQSSRRLHFGLGERERIDGVTIEWPDGSRQALPPLAVNKVYRIVQDQEAQDITRAARTLADGHAEPPTPTGQARIIMRAPLPLPPAVTALWAGSSAGRSKLVNLWAQWCAPCVVELGDFAARATQLHQSGLDVVALNVDKPEDRAKARRLFEQRIVPGMATPAFGQVAASAELLDILDAVRLHIVHRPSPLPTPMTLLVDPQGALQALYLGPVDLNQVLADQRTLITEPVQASRRGAFPGRWYYRIERDLPALAEELRRRGQTAAAAFYDPPVAAKPASH